MTTHREVRAVATTTISATPAKVWKTLAEEFDQIERWSSAVKRSRAIEPHTATRLGAPVGGRECEIVAAGFSDTAERILEYRPNTFISYELFDGLPGFVLSGINSWTLSAQTGGGVRLDGETTMRVTGVLGWMLGGFMRSAARKALQGMCEEVKYYLETGNPHPRKQQAIAKYTRSK